MPVWVLFARACGYSSARCVLTRVENHFLKVSQQHSSPPLATVIRLRTPLIHGIFESASVRLAPWHFLPEYCLLYFNQFGDVDACAEFFFPRVAVPVFHQPDANALEYSRRLLSFVTADANKSLCCTILPHQHRFPGSVNQIQHCRG